MRLFQTRLKNHPEVSETTLETLCRGDVDGDFGDDEELLRAIVEAAGDDA
jgi:hypothetical protein